MEFSIVNSTIEGLLVVDSSGHNTVEVLLNLCWEKDRLFQAARWDVELEPSTGVPHSSETAPPPRTTVGP